MSSIGKYRKMPSGENSISTQFSTDNQPITQGRKKGSKNRSTIARQVLEMIAVLPESTFEQIREVFPDIEQSMSSELVATLAIISNAAKGDVQAYKAIMDSAYGLPKSEIEHSGSMEITGITLDIKRNREA